MPQMSYEQMNQIMSNAIAQKAGLGGVGGGNFTQAQLDALYGPDAPATTNNPGMVGETAKAVARGLVGIPQLATKVASGAALDVGALFGVRPEDNTVEQAANQGTQFLDQFKNNPQLAANQQYAQEHPVGNFVRENIEGGIPWMGAAALSKIPVVGKYALPAAATLAAQSEGTHKLMDQGVSGNEALGRSTPGALTEGTLFALMHPAMSALKGTINPATIDAAGNAIAGGITRGLLPGTLGAPGGVLKGIAQGALADAPFLAAQGEIKQGVDVGAGAMTPDEWAAHHTPGAIAHTLGSSLVGGMGFGAIGAIGQRGAIDRANAGATPDATVAVPQAAAIDPNKPLTQMDLPNVGVQTKAAVPPVETILPNGSGLFDYKEGLQRANALKKGYGITAYTKQVIDVTGNKKLQVSLEPPSAPDFEQGSFNFNSKDQGLSPLEAGTAKAQPVLDNTQPADLTGSANAQPTPIAKQPEAPKMVTPIEPIASPVQADTFHPEASTAPVAANMPTDGVHPPMQEAPIEAPAVKAPVAEKAGKAPRAERAKVLEPTAAEPTAPEPTAPQGTPDSMAEGNARIEATIKDFMTNPKSTVDPHTLAEALGEPVQNIVAAREHSLRKVAKKAEEPVLTPPERAKAEKAAKALGEEVGKNTNLSEVQQKLKDMVGDATPETEAEQLKKANKAGWEGNDLSRDMALSIHEDGGISNGMIKDMMERADTYEDAPKKTKNPTRDKAAYKEKALGVLKKGVDEGILKEHPDGYVLADGVKKSSFKDWYANEVRKRGGNSAEGIRAEQKASMAHETLGDSVEPLTKADMRRSEAATAIRDSVTKRAQRPSSIYVERMKGFKNELKRLNDVIAKLPEGAQKRSFRTAFNKTEALLKEHLKEGHAVKLNVEQGPLYKELQDKIQAIKDSIPVEKPIFRKGKNVGSQMNDNYEEDMAKAIAKYKSGEGKDTLDKIEALKARAKDEGRLVLTPRVRLLRELIEGRSKKMDLTGIEKQETAEARMHRLGAESDFLAEMSRSRTSKEERLSQADDIIDMLHDDTAREKYDALKTDAQKSEFLKKAADTEWNRRDKLNKLTPGLETKVADVAQLPPNVDQTKSAKELELEKDAKLKAQVDKEKTAREKVAELQRKAADKAAKKAGLETMAEAKERLAREADAKAEADKVQEAKAAEEARIKEHRKQDIANAPDDVHEFNFKWGEKGFESKAGDEYKKFLKQKARVGASSSVPNSATKFISHLAEKFHLGNKFFITSETDINASNIADVAEGAKAIKDANGDYVGMIYEKNGVSVIALNNSKIGDTKTLVNVLSHEAGHAIINAHAESADPATWKAISDDYSKWTENLSWGDSAAMDELYQESGKTWDNFISDYKDQIANSQETIGKDGTYHSYPIMKDSMFHEYVAEQVAKYIKVNESKSGGAIYKFFRTLAEKLKYIFDYGNKELLKNRQPIQSVKTWLDGLTNLEDTGVTTSKKKVNSSEASKTNVGSRLKDSTEKTIDNLSMYAKEFRRHMGDENKDLAKGLTDLVGENTRDSSFVNQAINGVIRLPFWRDDVRPATNNFGKSLEINSSLKHFFKNDDAAGANNPKDVALKDIGAAYEALPKPQRALNNRLLIEGDKLGVEFNSKKDITNPDLQGISDAAFAVYKNTRAFISQSWDRMCKEFAMTQAHMLTDKEDLRIPLKEAISNPDLHTKEQYLDFLKAHRDIRRDGLDSMVSKPDLDMILDQITEKDGIKDQFLDYSKNFGAEGLKGYIPRERLEGAEWTVNLHKQGADGNPQMVYRQDFYTKGDADRAVIDIKANPDKYLPKNSVLENGEKLLFDNMLPKRIPAREKFGYSDDEAVARTVSEALKGEDITEENKASIIARVRKDITKNILARHGAQHTISRSKTLIEGYNEDSPLGSFETVLNRTANSFAKMRYIRDQADLLANSAEEKRPAIAEYVNNTLSPKSIGGKQAQMLKNTAAVYFMGFRPLTAIMQLAQLHTVGAAELGMHLGKAGIKTPAHILLLTAGKDMLTNNLSKVEENVLKRADDMGITFEHSSQTSLFKGIDDTTVRSWLGKRLATASDIGMKGFQYMETYNRRSAILAAYRVFAKGKEGFSKEAFDRATDYNNRSNFMMNKGNIPYWLSRNPIGMTAYALMSYTMNMSNLLVNRFHGSLSDTDIDPWTQRRALMKLLGYTAVLGGMSAVPFANDLNKAIRKFGGRDLKQETSNFIKKNAGEDIANLITDGVFAPAGLNISNNMSINVPFISGLLDDSSALESVSGASGALVTKGWDAVSGLYNGQYRKAAEAAAPEFLSSVLRAERLNREGQRTSSGQPVYYQGKQIKLTDNEAIMQGALGIKSERRANMMDTADAEQGIQQYWQNQKKIAESKAMRGDYSAKSDFNKRLVKDKEARILIGGITKLDIQKPTKGKTAYEQQ